MILYISYFYCSLIGTGRSGQGGKRKSGGQKKAGRKKKNGRKKKSGRKKKPGRSTLLETESPTNIDLINETICLEPNYLYSFSIHDSFGDGVSENFESILHLHDLY